MNNLSRGILISCILISSFFGLSLNTALAENQYQLPGYCTKYSSKESYLKAIQVVASYMKYSPQELCELPRLADIYVVDTNFYNPETRQDEDHIWITLHYSSYSCQYFVRNADFNITKKDCYDTW